MTISSPYLRTCSYITSRLRFPPSLNSPLHSFLFPDCGLRMDLAVLQCSFAYPSDRSFTRARSFQRAEERSAANSTPQFCLFFFHLSFLTWTIPPPLCMLPFFFSHSTFCFSSDVPQKSAWFFSDALLGSPSLLLGQDCHHPRKRWSLSTFLSVFPSHARAVFLLV